MHEALQEEDNELTIFRRISYKCRINCLQQICWSYLGHQHTKGISSLFVQLTKKTFDCWLTRDCVRHTWRCYGNWIPYIWYPTCILSQFSYWLFLYTLWDHCSTTASLMPAPYIPDTRLETYGRYNLYEIGFLTVSGCLCLTRFQWKLNLWIWCSGVWPMNCFDRNRCHLGWVDLWDDKDLLGSEFPDHLDHGRPNELMNFCPEWSHQFIWSSMIWEISDHLSSFGPS